MTPLGSNEVAGTSSLGNVEISQTESKSAASLLLGRMKSRPLTSQIQSLALVPCWEGCGWSDRKAKARIAGPLVSSSPSNSQARGGFGLMEEDSSFLDPGLGQDP